MAIIIGADFVPTETNIELYRTGNAKELVGEELISLLNGFDFRIFNLEMPLVDKVSPISKCGPNLIAPTDAVCLYKELRVDLMTLANNHIMDQGEAGLSSTISTLDKNSISYFGVGENVEKASEPYIVNSSGKKIGIYGCVEHEFSTAGESSPGANPYDPLYSYDHVRSLKAVCDYVIVLYHGGKEFYRYPSPALQKACRKFAECGADLVLCQHSHCIGCMEKYAGATIVYGQGNFLFDHGNNEYWQTGLLVGVSGEGVIDFYPVVKHENNVRLADLNEKAEILDAFNARSKEITDQSLVEAKYRDFAEKSLERYLLSMYGITNRNILFRVINKITGHRYEISVLKRRYRKESLLYILNYVDCEAQRELLIKGLKDRIED